MGSAWSPQAPLKGAPSPRQTLWFADPYFFLRFRSLLLGLPPRLPLVGCLESGHSSSEAGLVGSELAGLAAGVARGGLLLEGAVAAGETSGSCLCRLPGENNSSISEGNDSQSLSSAGRPWGQATGCSKAPMAEAMVARELETAPISLVTDSRCLFALS